MDLRCAVVFFSGLKCSTDTHTHFDVEAGSFKKLDHGVAFFTNIVIQTHPPKKFAKIEKKTFCG
jgi:hypothetical protein